ncbi:hypothetical protein [Nitrospina gracilis]|nr:hypothetical protein [Nitrospina gracilis]
MESIPTKRFIRSRFNLDFIKNNRTVNNQTYKKKSLHSHRPIHPTFDQAYWKNTFPFRETTAPRHSKSEFQFGILFWFLGADFMANQGCGDHIE